MKDLDIKIDLGAVQETQVIPLWARAKDAEKNNPILGDIYASVIDLFRHIRNTLVMGKRMYGIEGNVNYSRRS